MVFFDNIDMEEDNIDMEEVLTYRKRPYRCVKRPETTDTEHSCDSSESTPSLVSANNLATLSLIFAR
jgi:hypothetical protein